MGKVSVTDSNGNKYGTISFEMSKPHGTPLHVDAYTRNVGTGKVVSQDHHKVTTNLNK